MFSKETMSKAREIRKQAASKYACEVKEIIWPLCVSMAYKGETIMEQSLKKDILKPDGRTYTVECTKTAHWNCGLKLVRYTVNGIIVERRNDTFLLNCPEKERPVFNGKRIDGIKMGEILNDFIAFEAEAEKEYIAEQNKVKIDKYIIHNSTSYGFSVKTEPKTERRSDVEKAKNLFKNKAETKEAIKGFTCTSDMGDYNITDEYILTPNKFEELVNKVEKAVEESNKVKTEKETKEKEESLKRKQAMSDEELIKAYFTETVKVDEDGCFSSCGDFCDDCIDVRVWKKDVAEVVRKAAETYTVSSKKGKQYFYKAVCPKTMHIFIETQKEAINKVRQSFK